MNVEPDCMIRCHTSAAVVNPIPFIMEYLLVTDHPPTIEDKDQRGVLDFLNKVAH